MPRWRHGRFVVMEIQRAALILLCLWSVCMFHQNACLAERSQGRYLNDGKDASLPIVISHGGFPSPLDWADEKLAWENASRAKRSLQAVVMRGNDEDMTIQKSGDSGHHGSRLDGNAATIPGGHDLFPGGARKAPGAEGVDVLLTELIGLQDLLETHQFTVLSKLEAVVSDTQLSTNALKQDLLKMLKASDARDAETRGMVQAIGAQVGRVLAKLPKEEDDQEASTDFNPGADILETGPTGIPANLPDYDSDSQKLAPVQQRPPAVAGRPQVPQHAPAHDPWYAPHHALSAPSALDALAARTASLQSTVERLEASLADQARAQQGLLDAVAGMQRSLQTLSSSERFISGVRGPAGDGATDTYDDFTNHLRLGAHASALPSSLTWQDALLLSGVLVAVGYVFVRVRQRLVGSPGHGRMMGSGTRSGSTTPPLGVPRSHGLSPYSTPLAQLAENYSPFASPRFFKHAP